VRRGLQQTKHRNLIRRYTNTAMLELLPVRPTFESMAKHNGDRFAPQHLGYLNTDPNHVGEFVQQ
jgi:hypothetical protein